MKTHKFVYTTIRDVVDGLQDEGTELAYIYVALAMIQNEMKPAMQRQVHKGVIDCLKASDDVPLEVIKLLEQVDPTKI